ncbi:MAG TPA: sialidase family protein [Verrucomicrobiae bacterium]|nr:sialidase family protein [Verrucomicrobiae bacterium]
MKPKRISISIILALLIGTFCASPAFARGNDPQFVTVFERGKEGFPEYRIPSLLVTKHGVLLAFAEGRLARSDHAQNKIVLKRSIDGGRSWRPLQVVHDAVSNVLVNPCAVALDSGRVLLMYEFFPAGYHSRVISTNIQLLSPGLRGDKVGRTLLQWSDDDGATWSAPHDVTAQTKHATKITSTTSGPGIGIQLQRGPHKGRILIPSSESWWVGRVRFNNIYACMSDDGGRTWRRGQTAPNNVGLAAADLRPETFVITLANGELQGYLVTKEAVEGRYHEAGNALFASPGSGERLLQATRQLLDLLPAR